MNDRFGNAAAVMMMMSMHRGSHPEAAGD